MKVILQIHYLHLGHDRDHDLADHGHGRNHDHDHDHDPFHCHESQHYLHYVNCHWKIQVILQFDCVHLDHDRDHVPPDHGHDHDPFLFLFLDYSLSLASFFHVPVSLLFLFLSLFPLPNTFFYSLLFVFLLLQFLCFFLLKI